MANFTSETDWDIHSYDEGRGKKRQHVYVLEVWPRDFDEFEEPERFEARIPPRNESERRQAFTTSLLVDYFLGIV